MSNKGDLESWLEERNLGSYLSTLNENGVNCLNDFKFCKNEKGVDDLVKDLGIEKRFVCNKLKQSIMHLIGIKSINKSSVAQSTPNLYAKDLEVPILNDNYNSIQLQGNASNELYPQNEYNPHKGLNYNDNKIEECFNNLTVNSKRELILNYNLLCGRSIDDNGNIIIKSTPIFKLLPSTDNYNNMFFQEDRSNIQVKTSYSSSYTELAKTNYYSIAAKLEAEYNGLFVKVAAKAEMSKSSQSTSHSISNNEQCSYIAQGIFNRGKIILNNSCVVLTKQFIN
eukprot:408557_1